MPRIGKKTQLMLPQSHTCLHAHKQQVEQDAEHEQPGGMLSHLNMVVVMVVMMMFH